MSDIAIRVENLGKMYRIGVARPQPENLWQAARNLAASPFAYLRRMARPPTEEETLWALRDVSFEVKRGEVLGIIGRNGAGKSTLLKILSRITEPTEGQAQIHGRVGSLLEVGTGFHEELTGRENIYLNGAILGMRRAEIDSRFDEIVDFSGVEKLIDTPVKRYSSGMRVRLGFSVAAHLEPEILLIDEVLAVGDIGFQRKCLGKMGVVATEGRAIIFVSHNMAAVEALCSSVCRLEDGELVDTGIVPQVIAQYRKSLSSMRSIALRHRIDRQGNGSVRLTDCSLVDEHGREIEVAVSGQDLSIVVSYEAEQSTVLDSLVFGVGVFAPYGQNLIQCSNEMVGIEFQNLPPSGRVGCRIPRLPLAPGSFSLNLIVRRKGDIEDWIQDAMQLNVEAGAFFSTGRLPPASHGGLLVDQDWYVD